MVATSPRPGLRSPRPTKGPLPTGLSLLICLASTLPAGCARKNVPELLTLTDVAPHEIHPGDRVEVSGVNLPVGQVDDARVVLTGDVFRAGEPPLRGQRVEVARATLEREHVTFLADDELLGELTGGDNGAHATFRGQLKVELPSTASGLPVFGTIKGDVVLEWVPRTPSRETRAARDRDLEDATGFLGLRVEDDGAVTVKAVRPGSPADRAGLRDGDVIERVGGLTVLGADDLLIAEEGLSTSFTVRRGEEQLVREVATEGFGLDSARRFDPRLVVLIALGVFLLLVTGRRGQWLSWIAHRLREALEPHRAAGRGTVAALLCAATQAEVQRKPRSETSFSDFAPVLVFAGVTVSFAALPFVELGARAELDVGLTYLVPLTAVVAMALITGGWGSSPSPVWGRLRAVLDVLVCQLPAAAALLAVVLRTGSLRALDMVKDQVESGGALTREGSWPWTWNALRSPQLFLLFALFFGAALVDGSRAPAQRGGRSGHGAMFAFVEWIHILAMCALAAVVFLGGWAPPGVSLAALSESPGLKALAIALFVAKCWALVLGVLVLRAALPRIRPDFVLRLGLVVALPASLVACGLTALSQSYPLLPSVERALGWVTLLTALAVAVVMLRAVAAGPESRGPLRTRLNPYL